jgi:DDE superfamily endonuclease
MLSLPIAFTSALGVFAPAFSRPVWQHVKVLMTGAVLAPGKRTVTAILEIMGRRTASDFQTYHRVLHRAVWAPLTASRLLLRFLVAVFVPSGVVVCGLDDTIERRRGNQITAKGIYRDPGRSSHAHFVQVSGLRWLACMVLVPLAWADCVWALPCPDGPVSLRVLLCATGSPPSALDGTGVADDPAPGTLVAGTRDRLWSRQPFCGTGAAGQSQDLAWSQCAHATAS